MIAVRKPEHTKLTLRGRVIVAGFVALIALIWGVIVAAATNAAPQLDDLKISDGVQTQQVGTVSGPVCGTWGTVQMKVFVPQPGFVTLHRTVLDRLGEIEGIAYSPEGGKVITITTSTQKYYNEGGTWLALDETSGRPVAVLAMDTLPRISAPAEACTIYSELGIAPR